jgi:3-deoxy-manno-octulosonate cytidylyltransferase (CMP-KDO synthetase)
MRIVGIIPARMASTRFPGKPMADIVGMPMIGHCHARSEMSKLMDEVYTATCDNEIFDYIQSIGGKAIMTADTHERATDRTAEAVAKIEQETGEPVDMVVMIQGDEPMVVPEMLDLAIKPMIDDPKLNILNIIAKIPDREIFESANTVKLVVDNKGGIMYLSRSPIPSDAKYNGEVPMLKQLGIILFRRDFLFEYNNMEQTLHEIIESCDMLRVIENGIRLQTVLTDIDTWSVDTPEDLELVKQKMKYDKLVSRYLNV